MILNKDFDSISRDDINYLIENRIIEDKYLEYKRALPSKNEEGKKEFCADVSAFANTLGGFLIYGIDANNGIPKEITGILDNQVDSEKLWIENMIRDGISPRIIPPVKIKSINISKDNNVILLKIDKSLSSPHMVKSNSKFYLRNSAGKYQMDIDELRTSFLLSENLTEKIKNFRLNRISSIISDDMPINLIGKDRLILHIIPFQSFSISGNIDLNKVYKYPSILFLGSKKFNLDGLFSYDKNKAYCQIFRNGIIESVISDILYKEKQNHKLIIKGCEEKIIKDVYYCNKFFKEFNIFPPYLIAISMIGIRNSELPVGMAVGYEGKLYEKDNMILPEIIIEEEKEISDEKMIKTKLKPVFDMIWNAYGFPCWFNYDEK